MMQRAVWQPRPIAGGHAYLLIATRIKHAIASGQLQRGDKLPSLRDGATQWGVNLHTVRRAYGTLEEDGFVVTHPRSGTHVRARHRGRPAAGREELEEFLSEIIAEAHTRFGLSPADLAPLVGTPPGATEPVWVLECSPSLARSLAAQVADTLGLDARPWDIRRQTEIPDGSYLATFYHFAEVSRLLADRWRCLAFFGVHLHAGFLKRVQRAARRRGGLVLLAAEAASGGALASELEHALAPGVSVELALTRRPQAAIARLEADRVVVVTPDNWDRLPEPIRQRARLFPLMLEADRSDLQRIAEAYGWRVGGGGSAGGSGQKRAVQATQGLAITRPPRNRGDSTP